MRNRIRVGLVATLLSASASFFCAHQSVSHVTSMADMLSQQREAHLYRTQTDIREDIQRHSDLTQIYGIAACAFAVPALSLMAIKALRRNYNGNTEFKHEKKEYESRFPGTTWRKPERRNQRYSLRNQRHSIP